MRHLSVKKELNNFEKLKNDTSYMVRVDSATYQEIAEKASGNITEAIALAMKIGFSYGYTTGQRDMYRGKPITKEELLARKDSVIFASHVDGFDDEPTTE